MLVQQIIPKFYIDFTTKLEERKAPTDAWTVESLRKSIRNYVMVRENAQQHLNNSTERRSAKIPGSGKQSWKQPCDLLWKL